MAHMQENRFKKSTGYIQGNNPNPVTSCGRRRSPLTSKTRYPMVKLAGKDIRE
jgi:hypothetical protein